jgi:hypothetical protein
VHAASRRGNRQTPAQACQFPEVDIPAALSQGHALRAIGAPTEEKAMPWDAKNIGTTFKKGAGGMQYWVFTKGYMATIEGQKEGAKCEVHATIATGDIKGGKLSAFHIKFDDGGQRRVFFWFKESGGSASLDVGKTTKEADALKNFQIGKGEFAEMRAKAIGYAKDVAAQLRGE